MKIKSLILASAVAIAAATSAQAADVVAAREPAPAVVAPTPTFSWTGFYAGGQIGGSWSDSDVSATLYKTAVPGMSPDLSGFIGGLYAGYNFDIGNNVIIGAETDWIWADMDKTNTEPFSFDSENYTLDAKIKEKWAGATRIRVGYAVDRWLPYIAGGVAYAKVDSKFAAGYANSDNALTSMNGSDTMTGWTIGAGVDYAITQNIVARLEYRYSDFGDKDYSNDDGNYRVDYKTNDVRVGVAYKF